MGSLPLPINLISSQNFVTEKYHIQKQNNEILQIYDSEIAKSKLSGQSNMLTYCGTF